MIHMCISSYKPQVEEAMVTIGDECVHGAHLCRSEA